MKSRIMYIEYKGFGLAGTAWIGRVSFSQTGRTVYYRNLTLRSSKSGYKWNHFDVKRVSVIGYPAASRPGMIRSILA